MSEGSLPPFGVSRPRSLPNLLGRALGRLLGRRSDTPRRMGADPAAKPAVDPNLASRADAVLHRYAEAHAALIERAERLTEKSARLEAAGTPSDSAANRAARAREEVEDGLADLRGAFVASEGEPGGPVFDREMERRYPTLGFEISHRDA